MSKLIELGTVRSETKAHKCTGTPDSVNCKDGVKPSFVANVPITTY